MDLYFVVDIQNDKLLLVGHFALDAFGSVLHETIKPQDWLVDDQEEVNQTLVINVKTVDHWKIGL